MKQIRIFTGNSLEILDKIEPISIDLCYADPPFFTQRDFNHKRSNHHAYTDKWESMEEYLSFMNKIIQKIYNVLTPFGSFFLHCDYHANAYLRMLCDKIFGYNNLQSEIVWRRGTHSTAKGLDNVLDTIYYYTKSSNHIFNQLYFDPDKSNIQRYNKIEKETGRKFAHYSIEHSNGFKYKGEPRIFYKPDGTPMTVKSDIGWKWLQSTIDKRWKENPLYYYFNKNGKVRYKLYLDEYKGIPLTTDWTDLGKLGSTAIERTGYPTQKPEKLLERIIKIATNEGMCVLDPFCGSGTTMAVCEKLNRYGIGIDINPKAIEITKNRIKRNNHSILQY